jgi:hypothetical protein
MAQAMFTIERVDPSPSFDAAKFEILRKQELRRESAWMMHKSSKVYLCQSA